MLFQELSWKEFEIFISKLLNSMGFMTKMTKMSNDGGIDIIATSDKPFFEGTYVIQCKFYKKGNNIGEPTIRDLYGTVMSENANKGILITTTSFTNSAIKFSKNKQIELIDGNKLEEITKKHLPPEFIYSNKEYKEIWQLTNNIISDTNAGHGTGPSIFMDKEHWDYFIDCTKKSCVELCNEKINRSANIEIRNDWSEEKKQEHKKFIIERYKEDLDELISSYKDIAQYISGLYSRDKSFTKEIKEELKIPEMLIKSTICFKYSQILYVENGNIYKLIMNYFSGKCEELLSGLKM